MRSLIKYLLIAPALLFASTVMAIPSLQIGDADGGVCDSYNTTSEDCIVGDAFSITSLDAVTAYLVFAAVPMVQTDTFTIAPDDSSNTLSLVDSGYGTPPFEDTNSLSPHDIFATYVEIYAVTFDGPQTTISNTQPGNTGDTAQGYIEYININLASLTDGLHIDLFTCGTGSVETNDCQITSGQNFAPFSHDATYSVSAPATLAIFGIGLVGVGAATKRRNKSQ